MKKRQTQGDTAARLLDAAERLFGEQGYDAVGMRALAQEAKVNLAAATYHFGSKKALFVETFLRRLRAVNGARIRMLDEASDRSRAPDVETILDCLMRPPFQMGLEHPAFGALLARTMGDPPPFLHAVLRQEMEPNTQRFVAALKQALPHLSDGLLRFRVALAMGPLLMLTTQMSLRRTRNAAQDEGVLKEVIRFAASGMTSPPAGADEAQMKRLMQMKPPGPR